MAFPKNEDMVKVKKISKAILHTILPKSNEINAQYYAKAGSKLEGPKIFPAAPFFEYFFTAGS